MECPSCETQTRVVETRSAEDGLAVRRRRHCPGCGERFTTFERREHRRLRVRKRGGSVQRFDRAKLRASLLGAAHKRPVAAPDVERIIERIESAIESAGGETDSERIGELCLTGLRELDDGAYYQYGGTLAIFNPQIRESSTGGSVRAARDPAQLPAEPTARELRDD